MLKQNLNNLIIACLGMLFFVTACDDDTNVNGDSPLNDGKQVEISYSDSFEIKTYTIANTDDLNSKNVQASTLGSITDPRTGSTKNSVYFQVVPNLVNVTLGNNAVLDSIVLSIRINSLYGLNTTSNDVSVYRMTESIIDSLDYNTDATFATSTLLGQKTGVFNFETGETNTLNIKLSSTFGQELISQFGTATMESNENFLAYLNGLYLTTEGNNGNTLAVLDIGNTESNLVLHYSTPDSSGQTFNFNTGTRINHYEHNLTGSEAEFWLNDATNADSVIYLAPFGMLKTEIVLPNLDFLEGKLINKAQLVFKQADYQSVNTTNYPQANLIFTYGLSDDGTEAFLQDFVTDFNIVFGGAATEVTNDGVTTNEYTFSITQHLQRVLNGDINNNPLRLTYLASIQHVPGNLKLGGGNNSNFGVTLRLIYSEIN